MEDRRSPLSRPDYRQQSQRQVEQRPPPFPPRSLSPSRRSPALPLPGCSLVTAARFTHCLGTKINFRSHDTGISQRTYYRHGELRLICLWGPSGGVACLEGHSLVRRSHGRPSRLSTCSSSSSVASKTPSLALAPSPRGLRASRFIAGNSGPSFALPRSSQMHCGWPCGRAVVTLLDEMQPSSDFVRKNHSRARLHGIATKGRITL